MKLLEYFNRQSRTTLILMGLVLVACTGVLDYKLGPMVALMAVYMIPISIVSWFSGRWPGIFIAVAASLIWYEVKYMGPGYVTRHLLLLWNSLQRVGLLSAWAVLISEVAERKRVEQALLRAQEGLEARVRERTQELAQTNTALHDEVAERSEAGKKLKTLNETLEERVAERSAAAEERAGELARSEAALRQQTSILQSILNSMGDGVIVADAAGKVIVFNPAAEGLIRAGLGVAEADESSDPSQNYLPDTMTASPTHEHPLRRAIRGETVDGAEVFLRPSSSSTGIWLTATGRPLIDEEGRIRGGVVVYTDISSRKLMEKQIAEISDREQRRIGQDLHDTLCQHLVSIAFASELLRDRLARQNLAEAAQSENIAEMVNESISQARHLARGLYPVRLEVDGLSSALEELAAQVQARHNVSCSFSCDEPVLVYDEVAGNNLYRIAQEAVNNALKHGRSQNISIGLGAVEDELTLTIEDDGRGFPETVSSPHGMGLHIMNYRARLIDASLDIRRGVGGGTIVICSFHNEHVVINEHSLATQD